MIDYWRVDRAVDRLPWEVLFSRCTADQGTEPNMAGAALAGKAAIISGSGDNIGKAIAQPLARGGASCC